VKKDIKAVPRKCPQKNFPKDTKDTQKIAYTLPQSRYVLRYGINGPAMTQKETIANLLNKSKKKGNWIYV
jgi:hypothetical protein